MDHQLFEQDVSGPSPVGHGTASARDHQVGRGGPDSWQCSRRGLRHRREPSLSGRQRPRSLGPRLRAGCHRAGQGQSRSARDRRPFHRRQRPGIEEARAAVRHGDRLRAVPHLRRRGTPGVRPGVLPKCLGLEDCCTSSAFRTRNLEPRGQGESASRKSEMPSMMAGRSKQIEPIRFESIPPRDGPKFSPAARRHGWRRLNGRDMGGN